MSSRLPTEPRPRILRRPFPVRLVLVLAVVVTAGVGAGYGASVAIRARRAWLAQVDLQTTRLKERAEDLAKRHPDFQPPAESAQLEAFFALRPARRGRELGRAEKLLESVRQSYRRQAGSAEGDPYKSFSPNGFRLFYEELHQPGTRPPVADAPITLLPAADQRITQLAKDRGYKLRPLADESDLVAIGENYTHASALAAYRALQAASREAGIEIGLVSAYRSLQHQRSIFVGLLSKAARELRNREVTLEEIAAGRADDVVDRVLQTSAIPGYSKHHTGYAMDLVDLSSGRVFTDFGATPAHQWLAKDNYYNAKRFGFIPSYPPGASSQGPDPETWEYVWVGVDNLKETW